MEANLSPSKKRKQLVLDLVATLIVLLLALLVVLPIWWIFRSSLMSTAKLNEYPPSFIPHEWLWANYSKALETFEYWRYFRNTFSIIIPAVTFGTVTAIFCGYAFARLRFRGKKLIFNICVGTILLPSMVTLLPLYVVWTKGLGLGDTYWPLILPYLTGGGFWENIPRVLPKNTKAVIDESSWEWQPVFKWLQEKGNIETYEMYRTFNCGVGMVIALPLSQVETALAILKQSGENAWLIGHIESATDNEPQVIIK